MALVIWKRSTIAHIANAKVNHQITMPHTTPTHTADYFQQLLNLAPDVRTLEEARRLFFARGWALLAGDGQWLWGEYVTRDNVRYLPAVRLQPAAFRCTCKAPRRPCKHALALVLLFMNADDRWQTGLTPPEALLKPEAAGAPKREVAVSDASREKRLQLMDEGVEELEKWLLDLVRQGLAGLETQPPAFWQQVAARMTDFKLGSIGRRISALPQYFARPDWPDRLLAELGALYLFVRAWRRRQELDAPRRDELLQLAGFNLKKEEVLQAQPPLRDHWLVMGQLTGQEDRLTYRRVWLRGEKSGRMALLLDYSFGNEGFAEHWITGSALQGELSFYPGSYPLRAALRQFQASSRAYEELGGYSGADDMLSGYATALAANPWLPQLPALLQSVVVVWQAESGRFVAVDEQGRYLPLAPADEAKGWQLAALGAGRPIWLFGEYEDGALRPLSAVYEGRIIAL